MAVEPIRGCGYRTIGGIYLVCDGAAFTCGRLPIPLKGCPKCTRKIHFFRNLRKVHPAEFMHSAHECRFAVDSVPGPHQQQCSRCPFEHAFSLPEAGMMWVGEQHYTPGEFIHEAEKLGVSKRIHKLPKWFKVGTHWVYLAHRGAVLGNPVEDEPNQPGIFYAFKPSRLEVIVPDNIPQEEEQALVLGGFCPVKVPADDPDHGGEGERLFGENDGEE